MSSKNVSIWQIDETAEEGEHMHFTKMHGLGNDYLYVFGEVPKNIKDICIKLSDRHFGAGSDGIENPYDWFYNEEAVYVP